MVIKKRTGSNGSRTVASGRKGRTQSKRHKPEMPERGQGREKRIQDYQIIFQRAEKNMEGVDNENR